MEEMFYVRKHIEDYNINEEDREALKKAWDIIRVNSKTGASQKSAYTKFTKTCRYLELNKGKPFKEWDEPTVKDFFEWLNVSEGNVISYKKILVTTFKMLGIDYKILDVAESTIANEVNGYFPDFNTLDATLLKGIKEERPNDDPITGMNKYSTGKAVVYMSWLGLTFGEIAQIKPSDYHEKERCFVFEGQAFSFAKYPTMIAFFKEYSKADGIYAERSGVDMRLPYVKGTTFLKSTRAFKTFNVKNAMRGISDELGITYDRVHWSGCFDRVYEFEQQCPNRKLTKDNAEDIKFIIRSKRITDKSGYHFGYEPFMRKYAKYKELREGSLQQL